MSDDTASPQAIQAWMSTLAEYSMHLLWGGLGGLALVGMLTDWAHEPSGAAVVFALCALATCGISLLRDVTDDHRRDAVLRSRRREHAERVAR